MYPNVGHSSFQFHPVLCHRVFSYRAEQRLCHHPHAGLSTDSHLFPADFRLPYHAHTVCRRFGSGHFSHCSVFPVQELSAIQACKLSVSRIRIYRNGESAFSATDILCSCILDSAYSFQSLHPKSFFASLIGWSVPYWFLLGYAYLSGHMDLFYQPFLELVNFRSILFGFRPWELATIGYILLLYMVSSSHCLIAGYEDKIRTRSYLHFLIFLNFCIFVYIGLQPALYPHLFSLLLIGTSILIGHLFVLTNSRSSNLFFIIMLVGLFTLFGFNLWTLL